MTYLSQCMDCKHYLGHRLCEAFPNGIPEELFDGPTLHDVPFPGDGGVLYSQSGENDPLPKHFLDEAGRLAAAK